MQGLEVMVTEPVCPIGYTCLTPDEVSALKEAVLTTATWEGHLGIVIGLFFGAAIMYLAIWQWEKYHGKNINAET